MSGSPSSCPWPGRRTSATSPPSAWIASSISSTSWLAPPCSGPQSAQMPAEIEANRLACELPDQAHRRRGAVLLVVGVQDEEQVQDLDDLLVDLVRLGRDREHHVEEVRAVVEVVLRVDERLADRLLVREGGDGPHLREQARDGRCRCSSRFFTSSASRVEARQRAAPSPTGSPSGAPWPGSRRRSASCPRGSASGA